MGKGNYLLLRKMYWTLLPKELLSICLVNGSTSSNVFTIQRKRKDMSMYTMFLGKCF